jgi:hypothetical protein
MGLLLTPKTRCNSAEAGDFIGKNQKKEEILLN